MQLAMQMPLCTFGVVGRQTQCWNQLRWQCSFGLERLSTRRFKRPVGFLCDIPKRNALLQIIQIEVNELSTLYCNKSDVIPTRRRSRLHKRCRQNYRNGHIRDSSFLHARHQSVHTSRHRIGEASAPAYRLQRC